MVQQKTRKSLDEEVIKARGAKENLEQELGRSVISNTNALNYRYLDENLLENKVSDKNEQ